MRSYIDETFLVTKKSLRKEIFESPIWNNRCCYCGSSNPTTLDHIIPKAKKGQYVKNNLAPCCSRCNLRKKDKDLEDWYRKQSFFSEEKLRKILGWMSIDFENDLSCAFC